MDKLSTIKPLQHSFISRLFPLTATALVDSPQSDITLELDQYEFSTICNYSTTDYHRQGAPYNTMDFSLKEKIDLTEYFSIEGQPEAEFYLFYSTLLYFKYEAIFGNHQQACLIKVTSKLTRDSV